MVYDEEYLKLKVLEKLDSSNDLVISKLLNMQVIGKVQEQFIVHRTMVDNFYKTGFEDYALGFYNGELVWVDRSVLTYDDTIFNSILRLDDECFISGLEVNSLYVLKYKPNISDLTCSLHVETFKEIYYNINDYNSCISMIDNIINSMIDGKNFKCLVNSWREYDWSKAA